MFRKHILTNVWSAEHPNTGADIQHIGQKAVILSKTSTQITL